MSLPQRVWPAEPDEPDEPPAAGAPVAVTAATRWRCVAIPVLAMLIAGIVVGLLWAWLTPFVARMSDGAERVLAGEVAMAGLGLLVGLLVGVVAVIRPGPWPTLRMIGWLIGSGLGSLLAWRVGLLVGAPRLAA